jgi:uncharacterized protein (TIGR00661 family)
MKYIFGICTDGSGHITQAISVKQFLQKKQKCQIKALVSHKAKGFPSYLSEELDIYEHEGFNLSFNKNGEFSTIKTFINNFIRLPKIISSFIEICKKIKNEKPDAIVNFYEPLVGLSAIFFPKVKYISFGHQYAMTEDFYPKVEGFPIQEFFLRVLNFITSIRAKRIALSYYNFESKNRNLIACPPILRSGVYGKNAKKEDYILVYLIKEELLNDLFEEALKNKTLQIECFTKITKKYQVPPNITLNNLNGKLFIEKLKNCSAVICSGGFETSAEAIYHNKPLLLVPLVNHYEQISNANDVYINNYGLYCKKINFSYLPISQISEDEWFNSVEKILTKVFEM